MPHLLPHTFTFEDKPLHTLFVRGRLAWMAPQIGLLLGYPDQGQRLAGKITRDWGEELVAGQDFAMLVGQELAVLQAQSEVVPRSSDGLLVLFESGLHLTLVKTYSPLGRPLRCFLMDEVLPAIARGGVPAPEAAKKPAEAGAVVCQVFAEEQVLGQPLPFQGMGEPDWLEVAALADRHGIGAGHILAAASSLSLWDRPAYVRPIPFRKGLDWRVTFLFSPEAVALIEAWLGEQGLARAVLAPAA